MFHRPLDSSLFTGLLVALVFISSLTEAATPKYAEAVDEPTTTIEYEEELSAGDQDFPDLETSKVKKLTWADHLDDHSIYAGRSLMSSDNLAPSETDDSEDEDSPLKTESFVEKEWQLMFRSFDMVYESVSSSILQQIGQQTNLFDDIVARLEPKCKRDIYHIRESLKKHKLWALRMTDSNGKIPSGITYGKFSSPGDYEECLSVRVNEIVDSAASLAGKVKPERYKFHGKYCLLDFRLPMPERPKNKLLSIHDPVIDLSNTEIGKQFPEIKNYSGYASVLYEVGYMHAFCLPSSCDVADVYKSVGVALEGLHVIVNNTVDCQENPPDEPVSLRKSQVISIALLVLLFSNALIASVAHHLTNTKAHRGARKKDDDHKESGLAQWARSRLTKNPFYSECFSIQRNFNRLTKPDPRGLTFVHYTRIVAMALTVITHTAGMGTLQAITKPADASNSEQIFRDLIPQMLANAFTSIQIFFFMAGFMLVISTYPSIKRDKGHISFIEYAIKRAIRLMPGIAATICLNFLWPLVVDGPMLSYFVRMIVIPCESTWWRTMSFLSNFDHVEKMCLRHSYFSASDYQLHIMAFPLLILLYKQPMLSLFIAGLLTATGFVAQVIMILTKTVLPFMMVDYIDKEAFFNVVHYIHHPVWNHMSAFFYGFILGYVVVKQIRVNLSPRTIKYTWLIVLPAGIVSIFAPYFWNHYKRPIYRWQMVLYVLFDRFTLLTTCAWLSYASMVLSRAPKKPRAATEVSKPINNIPDIVSLDNGKQSQVLPDIQVQPFTESTKAESFNSLGSPASLPRQRSTPNLLSSVKPDPSNDKSAPTIRPAISSTDLSAQQATDTNSSSKGQPPVEQSAKPKKRPPVLSNVNTLCLILSRLTFQLYLFNMVVLWVDVNHSKYYWFFSYYFIITKALAVYICSSLFAMIFFITLESPCLTLYIMWVKSRAQRRADRQTRRETAASSSPVDTTIRVSPSPKSIKGSECNTSMDGLYMRMGEPEKPSFSFIDLSGPPPATEGKAPSDQTKM